MSKLYRNFVITSIGRKYRQHSKKERKTKNYNARHTKTDIKSTSFIEKFTGYAFIEWLFTKNTPPADDFKQKRKTSVVRAVEYEEHKVLQPIGAESAQQLKISTEESKPQECDINIQSQIVQPKTEKNMHVNLEGAQEEEEFETFSFKKRNISKLNAAEPSQQLKIETSAKTTKSKPQENNLEVQQNIHILKTEETKFAVKIKSNKVVLKQKSSREKTSNLSPKLKPNFRQAYIPSFAKPKKKIFASIEIQTDETSFDQRIVKNQLNYFTYHSESHIRKPFIPCSEYIKDQISPITASSGFVSRSDADFSPFQTSSPNPETSAKNVTFLFKNDETCAVEIYKNGRKQMLKNSFENEWTPLYFSMATQKPEIGEKAQIHFHQFPENVLYGNRKTAYGEFAQLEF
uniref:Uncharacterized protein n=1 Tax=Panagrolaimus davidi TaxID=227884 RepID=A0A914PP45_9BILA